MLWFWRESQVAQWFAPWVLHFIFLGISEVGLSHSWFLTLKILCSVGGQLSFQFKVEFFYFEISCKDSGLSLYSWIEWKPRWPVHGVLGQFSVWCGLKFGYGCSGKCSSSETFLYVARCMDETRYFSLASCHREHFVCVLLVTVAFPHPVPSSSKNVKDLCKNSTGWVDFVFQQW